MSNSLLTIDMITRKSLEIFENNLVLTRNVNRAYDDSFAVEGAKIGSTLRIRLPDRALVTDGAALQVQDDNEQYTTLAVSNQKHIGVNFTSAELTMQLDDFADRVLKPRISQLAASVDADVANAYKSIYGRRDGVTINSFNHRELACTILCSNSARSIRFAGTNNCNGMDGAKRASGGE